MMSSTLPLGTLELAASMLTVTLYQGNPDRKHNLNDNDALIFFLHFFGIFLFFLSPGLKAVLFRLTKFLLKALRITEVLIKV
jgi:hypothetical protein